MLLFSTAMRRRNFFFFFFLMYFSFIALLKYIEKYLIWSLLACVVFSRVTSISKYFKNRNHWAGPICFVVQLFPVFICGPLWGKDEWLLRVQLFQEVVVGREEENKSTKPWFCIPLVSYHFVCWPIIVERHFLILQNKEKLEG